MLIKLPVRIPIIEKKETPNINISNKIPVINPNTNPIIMKLWKILTRKFLEKKIFQKIL